MLFLLSASVTHDGMWYVVGGWGDTDSKETCEMFNPSINRWTLLHQFGTSVGCPRACVVRRKK